MLSFDIIVADDIRQEVAGKQTIVGIYSEEMYVPQFPFVIRQLAFLTRISGKGAIPEKFSVDISMSEGVNANATGVLPIEPIDEERWRCVTFPPIYMGAIEVKEETDIKIKMTADGEVVMERNFPIKLNPANESERKTTDDEAKS